jgi:hypothetical protein
LYVMLPQAVSVPKVVRRPESQSHNCFKRRGCFGVAPLLRHARFS